MLLSWWKREGSVSVSPGDQHAQIQTLDSGIPVAFSNFGENHVKTARHAVVWSLLLF